MNYLSLFSGIGGIERGFEEAGTNWTCIGYSEIDKYAKSIYNYHYPNHTDYGDVTKINVSELPDFNLLVGGFPCQAFSIAGKRQGFKETRGTLFFEIERILEAKRPEWLLLENVKGLLNHDGGNTAATIFRVLTELGYSVGWEVVNSCHFRVPQTRERIFIIGHLRTAGGRTGEILPIASGDKGPVQDRPPEKRQEIAWALRQRDYKDGTNFVAIRSGTWRTHKDGQGFREIESGLAPTIPARAREDGSGQPVIALCDSGKGRTLQKRTDLFPPLRGNSSSGYGHYVSEQSANVRAVQTIDRLRKGQNGRQIKGPDEPSFTLTSKDKHGIKLGTRIRRLTPKESERLQGFPDNWTKFGRVNGKKVPISDTQRYKTLGNAVTVNVIKAIAKRIHGIATPYYDCECGYQFEYGLGKYGCPNCCGEYIATLKNI